MRVELASVSVSSFLSHSRVQFSSRKLQNLTTLYIISGVDTNQTSRKLEHSLQAHVFFFFGSEIHFKLFTKMGPYSILVFHKVTNLSSATVKSFQNRKVWADCQFVGDIGFVNKQLPGDGSGVFLQLLISRALRVGAGDV